METVRSKENLVGKLEQGFTEINIGRLVKADWNYKEDDAYLLEKLVENIKRNGQIENLIVRELPSGFYEIVNGNHRFDALRILNKEDVVVYNLGLISTQHAQRIAIETNETRLESDYIKMAGIMKEIATHYEPEDLRVTMPFTENHFENLMNATSFDWEKKPKVKSGEQEDSDADPDDFREVKLKLPVVIADMFEQQIDRIRDVCEIRSKVSAIEAMSVCFAEMDPGTLRESLVGDGA